MLLEWRETDGFNCLFGMKCFFHSMKGALSCLCFVHPVLLIVKGFTFLRIWYRLILSLIFELFNRKSSWPEAAIPVRDRKMV